VYECMWFFYLMTVARKVGVYLFAEQHLTGPTVCVEGKLLCRGNKDYSFSRLDFRMFPLFSFVKQDSSK
jgi:hypothetical protein